ncbi:hypothetical protein J6Z48_01340 [bacterium]|nr:hypothetical protein [bacterium]
MNIINFKTIDGDYPILFTAPHARLHRKPTLTGKLKQPEPFTDSIVEIMCMNTGTWGMILTSDITYDPNYNPEKSNGFKKSIRNLNGKKEIKEILDIHGVKNTAPYDIGIFFTRNYYKSKHLAEMLQKQLKKGKLGGSNIAILEFPDNGQETIGEFGASQLQIPSIQIEIAQYIREDKNLRDNFIDNMTDVVNKEFK